MTIAFWCVFVGVVLPYVGFGIARNRGRGPSGQRLRDNRNPRDFPNRIEGLAKRAWDSHVNAFESLPGFAAAVIIAHLAQTPQGQIDILASVWVVARVAHLAFYLADRDKLRTSAQALSLICIMGLFVVAGMS
jgi:uncharacterized MAPEG superfamily protein